MSGREIQTKYTNCACAFAMPLHTLLDLGRRPRLPTDVVQKSSPCLPAALIRLQHHSLYRSSRLCPGVLVVFEVYIYTRWEPIGYALDPQHSTTKSYQLHNLHDFAPSWPQPRRLHLPPHPPNMITSKALKKPSKRKAAKRPSPAPAASPSI